MTRLTRLTLVLAAAVIAALLSIHVVSAATAGDAGSPIAKASAGLATFSGVGGPASTPTSAPSYDSSSANSSSTTAQPGYQAANEPQGQEASEPQGQEASEPQMTGSVQSIDSANHAFTLTVANGTVSVVTNAQTEFKDGLAGFGDLKTGMTVTVDGVQQGNGAVLASETKGSGESPESDTSGASSTQASGD